MPNAVTFPDLQLPDNDTTQLYNNMIFIAVLISILSALNLTVLFQYILVKRSRTLSIMRICGITRNRSILYYLLECMVIMVPVYVIGTVCYHIILQKILTSLFPYIAEGYSLRIYAEIFLLYLVVLTIAMLIMLCFRIKRNIVRQWKEGTI